MSSVVKSTCLSSVPSTEAGLQLQLKGLTPFSGFCRHPHTRAHIQQEQSCTHVHTQIFSLDPSFRRIPASPAPYKQAHHEENSLRVNKENLYYWLVERGKPGTLFFSQDTHTSVDSGALGGPPERNGFTQEVCPPFNSPLPSHCQST